MHVTTPSRPSSTSASTWAHPRTAGPTAAGSAERCTSGGAAWARMCGCTTGTPGPGSLCAASSAPRCSATSESTSATWKRCMVWPSVPSPAPVSHSRGTCRGPESRPLVRWRDWWTGKCGWQGTWPEGAFRFQIRVGSHIPKGEFGKTALRLRFEKLTATTYLCSVKNGLISLWSLIIHDFWPISSSIRQGTRASLRDAIDIGAWD